MALFGGNKYQEANEKLRQEVVRQKLEIDDLQRRLKSGPKLAPAYQSIAGLEQKVFSLDNNNRITYVNTALANVLGQDKNRLMDRPLVEIDTFAWGPGFVAVLVDLCRAKNEKVARERSYYDRDLGKDVHIKITVTPVDATLQIVIEDITEHKELEKHFERYVSPKVLEAMKRQSTDYMMPRRYELSVVFADLRGFTSMSEKMPPEIVRDTLNDYLKAMVAVVNMNDAMVDKIIGDEVMALVRAPMAYADHAIRAIKMAVDMQETHALLQRRYKAEGKVMPGIGIGINSGDMLVGNIGSDRKTDYTAVGHAVNLGSRLCSMAKEGETLISGRTKGLLLQHGGYEQYFTFEERETVEVKGISAPVTVYAVSAAKKLDFVLDAMESQANAKAIAAERKIFGKYDLLEELGRGGMGVVYKALHRDLGRIVTLKVLKTDLLTIGKQQKEMFKREGETASNLKHPHIIGIHEYGLVDGKPYFTMDYVEGCTLADVLSYTAGPDTKGSTVGEIVKSVIADRKESSKDHAQAQKTEEQPAARKQRPLPINQALALIVKLGRAINHAHERGVLHRDIKPSNVLVGKDGEPVLIDFGLAKQVEGMDLTMTGQILGTPLYMSPEQAEGRRGEISERSDIYSLGALMYELVTGRPPFTDAQNIAEVLRKVSRDDPPKARRINPRVPREVEIICEKAMSKEPTKRYVTAGAFADDIDRYLTGEPIQARPPSPIYIARKKIAKHRVVAGAIAAVSIAAVVVFAVWWRSTADVREQKWKAMQSAIALYEEKEKAKGKWILEYEDNFNRAELGEKWKTRVIGTGNIGLKDSALVFNGRNVQAYYAKPVYGNVRIEFDVMVRDSGEFEAILCADSLLRGGGKYYGLNWFRNSVNINRGWMLGAAGVLFDKNQTGEDTLYKNRWYHIIAKKVDDSLSFEQNGRLLGGVRITLPFGQRTNVFCGFIMPSSEFERRTAIFDNVKIYRQQLAEKVDVTQIGEAYYTKGQYEDALAFFDNVLSTYESPGIRGIALRRACNLAREERFYTACSKYFAGFGCGEYDSIMGLSERTVLKNMLHAVILDSAASFVAVKGWEAAITQAVSAGDSVMTGFFKELLFLHRPDALKNFEFMVRNDGVLQGFMDDREMRELAIGMVIRMNAIGDRDKTLKMAEAALRAGCAQELVRQTSAAEKYTGETKKGMRKIPGGTFIDYAGRAVYVSGFLADTTEVTQADYVAMTGGNPSNFKGDPKRPVETVTWFDAVLYCNARSRRDGLDTVYSYISKTVTGDGCRNLSGLVIDTSKHGYRLPTEAEWEYAYRAGTTADWYWGGRYDGMALNFGADSVLADKHAVYYGNSMGFGAANPSYGTHEVATKLPNAFGLYDIAGNVSEWCNDWYEVEGVAVGALINPIGPGKGTQRALRGGSWGNFESNLRAANRGGNDPDNRDDDDGFRVVLRSR